MLTDEEMEMIDWCRRSSNVDIQVEVGEDGGMGGFLSFKEYQAAKQCSLMKKLQDSTDTIPLEKQEL